MPYQPVDRDIFYIPNWNAIYPDLHPRYISTAPEKMRGHMMDFGTGGYILFGTGKTAQELKDAALALGLNESYINTNTNQIVVGQNVLATIPKVEFERRVKEKMGTTSDKEQAEIEAYLNSQTTRGVRPFIMDENEFKDRKRFNTRDSNNRVGSSGVTRAA